MPHKPTGLSVNPSCWAHGRWHNDHSAWHTQWVWNLPMGCNLHCFSPPTWQGLPHHWRLRKTLHQPFDRRPHHQMANRHPTQRRQSRSALPFHLEHTHLFCNIWSPHIHPIIPAELTLTWMTTPPAERLVPRMLGGLRPHRWAVLQSGRKGRRYEDTNLGRPTGTLWSAGVKMLLEDSRSSGMIPVHNKRWWARPSGFWRPEKTNIVRKYWDKLIDNETHFWTKITLLMFETVIDRIC